MTSVNSEIMKKAIRRWLMAEMTVDKHLLNFAVRTNCDRWHDHGIFSVNDCSRNKLKLLVLINDFLDQKATCDNSSTNEWYPEEFENQVTRPG